MMFREKAKKALGAAKGKIEEYREEIVEYYYGDFLYIIFDEPREVLFKIFKLKKKFYPLKYHISDPIKANLKSTLKKCKAIPSEKDIKKAAKRPFYSIKRLKTAKHRFQSTSKFPFIHKDEPPRFPKEVWFNIASHLPSVDNLIRVNKEFCDIFAPMVYGELNLFLTISSTDKMRLNDENFLTYGKDQVSDRPDSYSIYNRNRKGEHYDYHFMDVSRRTQFIDEDDDDYNPNVISKFTTVMHIFNEIINNDSSILRKYIRNIIFSTSVARGLNDLLDIGDSDPSFSPLFSEVKKLTCCNPPGYTSLDLPETFNQGDRILVPRRGIYGERYVHRGGPLSRLAVRKFPTEVYTKEVVGTSMMLKYVQNYTHTKELQEIENEDQLLLSNPYTEGPGYKIKEYDQFDQDPSDKEFFSLGIDSLDNFTTKNDAQRLLKSIITSLTSKENSKIFKTRILISGAKTDSALNPDPPSQEPPGVLFPFYNHRPPTFYEPMLFFIRN